MRRMRALRSVLKRTTAGATRSGGRQARQASSGIQINKYAFTLNDDQIAAHNHRRAVGRLWERMGKHQYKFLVEQGLTSDSFLLDVGCGSLRGGIHFVRHLDAGHYYGIDVNGSLIKAGLDYEIPQAGLEDKLPRTNLRVTDRFECDFGVTFDFILAQSVFSHLPLNHIRLCLHKLLDATAPGSRFFATFPEIPESWPLDKPAPRATAGSTYPEKDPYHYRSSDLEWVANSVGSWTYRYIGDWGHPRGQRMAEFTRV